MCNPPEQGKWTTNGKWRRPVVSMLSHTHVPWFRGWPQLYSDGLFWSSESFGVVFPIQGVYLEVAVQCLKGPTTTKTTTVTTSFFDGSSTEGKLFRYIYIYIYQVFYIPNCWAFLQLSGVELGGFEGFRHHYLGMLAMLLPGARTCFVFDCQVHNSGKQTG